MNCPKCHIENFEVRDYLASTDQLWMEFEAEIIDGYLYTLYYCRHCPYNERKKFDPQRIHDMMLCGEEE